jgi:hypothetical protein
MVATAAGDAVVLRRYIHHYRAKHMYLLLILSLGIGILFQLIMSAGVVEGIFCAVLCFAICITDYFRQVCFADGKSKRIAGADSIGVVILLAGILVLARRDQVSLVGICFVWGVSTAVTLIRTAQNSRSNQGVPTIDSIKFAKLQRSVLFDYFAGFGMLQITYLLAPLLSSATVSTELRLVLLVTGPSAILAQAFSVSGITHIMSNPNHQKNMLRVAGVMISLATVATALVVIVVGPKSLSSHLGPAWVTINQYMLMAMIMSATHGLVLQQSLPLRWTADPSRIFMARIWSLPLSVAAPALGLVYGGVNGCLIGLSISNVVNWYVCRSLMRKDRAAVGIREHNPAMEESS